MHKGLFITFEGPEGGGKSTHSALLGQYLQKMGFRVVRTREPGGTIVAEALRKLLLNPQNNIAPITELMLYEASRAQHVQEVLLPALKKGSVVICDRYTDATVAYQGYGRGLDLDTIKELNAIATGNLVPDMTIVLDIPVEKGLIKARELNKDSFTAGDRLERECISFHKKVRQGYLALARKEPSRIKVISTGKDIEETHKNVVAAVQKVLQRWKKKK